MFLVFAATLLAASSGHAATIYTGVMSGANEVPPNASTASGFITVTIDGNQMMVDLTWENLIGGNPAAAHIHCCTNPGSNVGVAVGFSAFPALASGFYSHTFDLLDSTIYTANFLNNFGGGTVEGARTALLAGFESGQAYSNIHNAQFPGGEIRANLTEAGSEVPEPSTALLLGVGLLTALGYRRSFLRRQ